MSQTLYAQYLKEVIEIANNTPGMRYDENRARFYVNEKPFLTYKQAKWYLDYIKKFGYNVELFEALIVDRDGTQVVDREGTQIINAL